MTATTPAPTSKPGASTGGKVVPAAHGTVLVPLDLGREADRALPVAAALAAHTHTCLDVVSLTSPHVDIDSETDDVRAHARRMGVDVDSVLLRYDDDVVGGILDTATSGHHLLCCATHARGPLGQLLLHSVSADIIRRSAEPVLLVGPRCEIDPRPTFTEILACIDHTAPTARVVAAAGGWARRLGAKVRLLTVVAEQGDMEAAWRPTKHLSDALHRVDVDATPEVVVADDPAEAILHVARGLTGPLPILATHHKPGVAHPALGRVALDVVRDSPFPVLVVPPRSTTPAAHH